MQPEVVDEAPMGIQVQGGTCQLHSLDAIVKSTGATFSKTKMATSTPTGRPRGRNIKNIP